MLAIKHNIKKQKSNQTTGPKSMAQGTTAQTYVKSVNYNILWYNLSTHQYFLSCSCMQDKMILPHVRYRVLVDKYFNLFIKIKSLQSW